MVTHAAIAVILKDIPPESEGFTFRRVWNLVFSQFDADGKGHYERLARPNIDTGMGLERLACVMQGVGNLFEVDTVQSVLHHVHDAGKQVYCLFPGTKTKPAGRSYQPVSL